MEEDWVSRPPKAVVKPLQVAEASCPRHEVFSDASEVGEGMIANVLFMSLHSSGFFSKIVIYITIREQKEFLL